MNIIKLFNKKITSTEPSTERTGDTPACIASGGGSPTLRLKTILAIIEPNREWGPNDDTVASRALDGGSPTARSVGHGDTVAWNALDVLVMLIHGGPC